MNILVVGADNLITIDKLMVPNSDPPDYINNATITWTLLDGKGTTVGTGTYSYIASTNGEYQTVIPASLTTTLIANSTYTLNQNVVATGFVSLFTDLYLARSPQSAQFTYCVRKDIENIFGAVNIQKWADIDNDGDVQKIDAKINWALQLSYDYVNSKLAGGPYIIPLAGKYPTIITCQAKLAAVEIYEARGLTNFDEQGKPIHQLQNAKDWADNVMSQIRAGILRLANALPQDIGGTIVPQAIKASNRRFSRCSLYVY